MYIFIYFMIVLWLAMNLYNFALEGPQPFLEGTKEAENFVI